MLLLFIVLTQNEWNEKQRAERKSEFSWDYGGNKAKRHNSENDDTDEDVIGPSLDMFLTSSNPNKQSTITSKSFKRPIHNELNDEPVIKNQSFNDNDDLDSIPLPSEPKGAEIAPPPTYDYYGPSGRGQKTHENFVSVNEMQNSISKGFENAMSRNKSRKKDSSDIADDVDDE